MIRPHPDLPIARVARTRKAIHVADIREDDKKAAGGDERRGLVHSAAAHATLELPAAEIPQAQLSYAALLKYGPLTTAQAATFSGLDYTQDEARQVITRHLDALEKAGLVTSDAAGPGTWAASQPLSEQAATWLREATGEATPHEATPHEEAASAAAVVQGVSQAEVDRLEKVLAGRLPREAVPAGTLLEDGDLPGVIHAGWQLDDEQTWLLNDHLQDLALANPGADVPASEDPSLPGYHHNCVPASISWDTAARAARAGAPPRSPDPAPPVRRDGTPLDELLTRYGNLSEVPPSPAGHTPASWATITSQLRVPGSQAIITFTLAAGRLYHAVNLTPHPQLGLLATDPLTSALAHLPAHLHNLAYTITNPPTRQDPGAAGLG